MAQINVPDFAGTSTPVELPNANGQQTMAGSRPVVIASNQSAIPVTGTFWQATQPVSGTITANAGTGTMAVSLASLPALATGSNVIGGVTQSGTWTVTANAGTGTFAISAASLPLPTGAASAANQSTLNTNFGAQADTSATSDTGTFSFIALFKRALGYLSTIASAASDTTTASPVRDANAGEYEVVAASVTNQVLGATGAAGDWLSHIIVQPATTSPGAVTIKDGTTTVLTIPATTVADLMPRTVALDLKSVSGTWNITTGTNVSVIGAGNFT